MHYQVSHYNNGSFLVEARPEVDYDWPININGTFGGKLPLKKDQNGKLLKNDSDFVITTNFGVLHKYIAGRANAYFVNNSGNISNLKITNRTQEFFDMSI